MNTHEVLVRARNLISDERDWCGSGPRNNTGGRCAVVAVQGVLGDNEWHIGETGRQYDAICCVLLAAAGMHSTYALSPGVAFGAFNDSHTHSQVLAAFDKAIAQTAPEPDTEFLNNVEQPVVA